MTGLRVLGIFAAAGLGAVAGVCAALAGAIARACAEPEPPKPAPVVAPPPKPRVVVPRPKPSIIAPVGRAIALDVAAYRFTKGGSA